MSAFTGLENNLISSLYLWANSSHISLTRSHFLLDLVNDFVRGWLAWTVIHWTRKLPHQQENLPFQITGLDFFRALRLMAAVDVLYQAQHHLFQRTYLDFNIETCYLLSLAVRTTERNNQENTSTFIKGEVHSKVAGFFSFGQNEDYKKVGYSPKFRPPKGFPTLWNSHLKKPKIRDLGATILANSWQPGDKRVTSMRST